MHPGRLRAAAAGREAAVRGAVPAELRGAQPQRPGLRRLRRTRCLLSPATPSGPAVVHFKETQNLAGF